jgi:RNA polymerase-binding transcription factor DksA
VEESNKHQLEGLLKARSDDMRQSRRSRNRRPVADPAPERRAADQATGAHAPARSCEACGGQITPHRLRAMPRATRCLECQRAAEHAAARS